MKQQSRLETCAEEIKARPTSGWVDKSHLHRVSGSEPSVL